MIDERLSNPAFISGKLHYWEGIPIESVSHCSPDFKDAWIGGWKQAESEHLHLRSQIARNRGNISSINGPAVLQ